jgi:hypothetical protein
MRPTRTSVSRGAHVHRHNKKGGVGGMKDICLSGETWQGDAEEQTIEFSGSIVLECSGCGEEQILLGLEEDWPKEHRDSFSCSGCRKTVTLAHRIDSTARIMRALLKSSIRPLSPRA